MPLNVEWLVNVAYGTWKNRRFHASCINEATIGLKNLESYRGKTDGHTLKLCDDYAMDVLGHRRYAPWLYLYAAVTGKFKKGWIPDNYYGAVVLPKWQGAYGKISELRPMNTLMFQSEAFPDLLSYMNGFFFDTTYRPVSLESVKDLLFKDRDHVVFKLNRSMRGQGVHVFDAQSFSVEQVKKLGNGLFQSFIDQHEALAQFAPASVATIRLMTVVEENGNVSVRACNLRLGRGADTHVQSKSQILVSIDLKSGAFADVGYTSDWHELRVHPTSHVPFAGNIVPAFKACTQTVTELHKKVLYVRCIGWDVTVDREDHVRVMEWNGDYPGLKFNEATQGPCFADLGWERLRNERAR